MTAKRHRLTKEEIDQNVFLITRRYNLAELIVKRVTLWLGIVALGYVAIYLPIDSAAGRETKFDFVAAWVAKVSLNQWAAWVLAVVCGGGWITERQRRVRDRRVKDARIADLEKFVDPTRSTSGLLPSGSRPKGI